MKEDTKRAHPRDFGIPEEHWQAAADYAGMVLFQHDEELGQKAKTEWQIQGPDGKWRPFDPSREQSAPALDALETLTAVDEAEVERLARFLAEEACAGSCMAVSPDRWRGHVGDARDMLRAAKGLDKAPGGAEASPVRVLATPVACNVGDER